MKQVCLIQHLVVWTFSLSVLAGTVNAQSGRTDPLVIVEPRPTDELFPNPGMGWQTFHRFADEDNHLAGLPSASAYFRFYWREVEPEPGRIDFARFDELLAHARRAGQKLAFRIMCTGSGQYMDVPTWLKEQGCTGVEFTYGGRKHWVPDMVDSKFQQAHFDLIRQLGERYDGHPDLDLVDIGSVGLWGEWHMSDTKAVDTGKPVPMPPVAVQRAIIEAWRDAFPKTSRVVLIGSDQAMTMAAQDGQGWRADCLGDMGGFSKTWNHMENYYLQQLERTGAQEAWKRGPVAFESCWDMRKWKEENWDIPYIFDYALRCHASYMNNKSAPIPDETRPEIERFLRRLGYRLAVERLEHAPQVEVGQRLILRILWGNRGVAPPYRDYRVAVRLTPLHNSEPEPAVMVSDTSIKGWLPGPHETELTLPIGQAFRAGEYRLALGLVAPGDLRPAVRLAIDRRDAEGWYPLSQIHISR